MKAWIGRVDGKSICVTEESAYDILDIIMRKENDPDGVEAGEYFVDIEDEDSITSDLL